jgi:hypothetical protein
VYAHFGFVSYNKSSVYGHESFKIGYWYTDMDLGTQHKTASENNCTYARESKTAHRKQKDVLKFYSSTDVFGTSKSGVFNCSAKGSEQLLWAGSRVARVNSTVGGARKLLGYIYTSTARMFFKNAPGACIMQRYGQQARQPWFKRPLRQRRGV